jgi:hypothetical protein
MKLKVKVAIVMTGEEAAKMRVLAEAGIASMERNGNNVDEFKSVLNEQSMISKQAAEIMDHAAECNGFHNEYVGDKITGGRTR